MICVLTEAVDAIADPLQDAVDFEEFIAFRWEFGPQNMTVESLLGGSDLGHPRRISPASRSSPQHRVNVRYNLEKRPTVSTAFDCEELSAPPR